MTNSRIVLFALRSQIAINYLVSSFSFDHVGNSCCSHRPIEGLFRPFIGLRKVLEKSSLLEDKSGGVESIVPLVSIFHQA